MAIYYKYLFSKRGDISDSEGIVYSALIYRALENPEFFNQEGSLDIEAVKAYINDAAQESGLECIDLPSINKTKLAESIGMTRDAVIKIIKRLQKKSILGDGFIVCPIELLEKGYIQLPVLPVDTPKEKGITSQQRVLYGLLRNRAEVHAGVIDTWARRIADIFCTTKGNIYYMLSVLERKGYLERLPDGKLKIK